MKRETTQTLVGRAGDDARPFLERDHGVRGVETCHELDVMLLHS